MTATTTSKKPISPDDLCGICELTRENHGDPQHQFSMEGILIQVEKGPPARATPPRERGEAPLSPQAEAMNRDPLTGLTLRLIEVLTAKELLSGEDLAKIFGGK